MEHRIKPKHTETNPVHTAKPHTHTHTPQTKEQQIEHARAQLLETVKELGGDGKAIASLVASGLNLNNLADSTKGLKVGDAIKAVHKGKEDPDKLNQLRNELSLLQVLGDPQLLQAEGESQTQIRGQQVAVAQNSMQGQLHAASAGPLNIGGSASGSAPIGSVSGAASGANGQSGATLAANKAAMVAQLKAMGATQAEINLIIAMGMLETQHMDPSERDASKDGTPSANYSAFNLNPYLLNQLGFRGDPNSLNDPKNLGSVMKLMLNGVRGGGSGGTMSTTDFLNIVRGGQSANANDPNVIAYRNGIATINAQIAADPSLLTDNRRVNVTVNHI
jgi:hypothetical protein